mmetsp:Transcript_5312/g.11147  ORF Transcript_5312/g.11147 Transcript_5312/m.11147 type:complete len:710 (-) Transcript_5312:289-2418(-)
MVTSSNSFMSHGLDALLTEDRWWWYSSSSSEAAAAATTTTTAAIAVHKTIGAITTEVLVFVVVVVVVVVAVVVVVRHPVAVLVVVAALVLFAVAAPLAVGPAVIVVVLGTLPVAPVAGVQVDVPATIVVLVVVVSVLVVPPASPLAGWQGLRERLDHVCRPQPHHRGGHVRPGPRRPGAFHLVAELASPAQKGQPLRHDADRRRPKETVEGLQLEGDAAGAHDDRHDHQSDRDGQDRHGKTGVPHGVEVFPAFLGRVKGALLPVGRGFLDLDLSADPSEALPGHFRHAFFGDRPHIDVEARGHRNDGGHPGGDHEALCQKGEAPAVGAGAGPVDVVNAHVVVVLVVAAAHEQARGRKAGEPAAAAAAAAFVQERFQERRVGRDRRRRRSLRGTKGIQRRRTVVGIGRGFSHEFSVEVDRLSVPQKGRRSGVLQRPGVVAEGHLGLGTPVVGPCVDDGGQAGRATGAAVLGPAASLVVVSVSQDFGAGLDARLVVSGLEVAEGLVQPARCVVLRQSRRRRRRILAAFATGQKRVRGLSKDLGRPDEIALVVVFLSFEPQRRCDFGPSWRRRRGRRRRGFPPRPGGLSPGPRPGGPSVPRTGAVRGIDRRPLWVAGSSPRGSFRQQRRRCRVAAGFQRPPPHAGSAAGGGAVVGPQRFLWHDGPSTGAAGRSIGTGQRWVPRQPERVRATTTTAAAAIVEVEETSAAIGFC